MGQYCHKQEKEQNVVKQDKNIDDRRMLKVGIEVLKKDFCVQIGYNRRAVKTYGEPKNRVEDPTLRCRNENITPSNEEDVSDEVVS